MNHVQVSEETKSGGGGQPCPILSTHLTIPVSQECRIPSERCSQGNTQVLHQRGFEFIRHTVGRLARKQYVLPKALDHISHTLCAPLTTSTDIKRYQSFDVAGPYCITPCNITAQYWQGQQGESHTLYILIPTREPQRTKCTTRVKNHVKKSTSFSP